MNFKKILLAVDASENATRAVEYVGSMTGGGDGFTIRLLCIERLPNRDMFANETEWESACTDTRANLRSFLDESRKRLVDSGVPESNISEKYIASCRSPFDENPQSCSRGTSVAKEIMETMEQEGCGTVVVGRRGMTKAEEFLFGSISNKVIHSARNCTVWVVA